MEVFSPKLKDYPGHRLALSSKVGSMKFVAAARIIAELQRYFTGFTKMRKFLSKKSNKPPSPTSSHSTRGGKPSQAIMLILWFTRQRHEA